MATSISTTYAGEFAGKYIQAALLSGKTLGEETITILPNIVHKQIMQKVKKIGGEVYGIFSIMLEILEEISKRVLIK